MAYNLQPLITILKQILDPEQTNRILDDFNKPQLQSLLQKAASLQEILENPLLPKLKSSLEIWIRDAAHRAEDIIESKETLSCPEPDMEQVIQELDSAMEQVERLVEVEGKKVSKVAGDLKLVEVERKKVAVVVGVDGDVLQLKDRLTGTERKLEIVPIVGMGGIGKTTLTRMLYQDSFIVEHFMSCAWATVSQDYDTKAIVSELLGCVIGKEFDDKHIKKEVGELKDIMYKSLYGRRYMIVLDDMWSTQAWDDIRRCFPDTNNGSRIVITTRESDVAKHVDSQGRWHQLKLLNESQGWYLLRQTVFGETDCPDELQDIGRGIVSRCGGLPLAISVIGGLLSGLQRSKNAWESISANVRREIAESSDERISNILSLSYDHLPNHLKPCFLYMGAFPEDHKVEPSRLIRLWIAEGFVKSNNNNNKSMEEEAEDYLKALVVRNLVLVNGSKYAETYSMHDLLRDLCTRKGEEDRFVCAASTAAAVKSSSIRRLSLEQPDGIEDIDSGAELLSSLSLARTFICEGATAFPTMLPFFLALRFVRVLDAFNIMFIEFPEEILQIVNLRYLALFCISRLPAGISKLLNLQTLIFHGLNSSVPSELWEMSELRHLRLYGGQIDVEEGYTVEFVHKKLQTINYVTVTDWVIGSGFFDNFPNIVELAVLLEYSLRSTLDLRHHQKLRNLTCSQLFEPLIEFPSSLRELQLVKCRITSRVMSMLCALPNLEVLKMENCDFETQGQNEEEWVVGEGEEFRRLQFLHLLKRYSLVRLRCDETNFPSLTHLVIQDCPKLEEIPSGVGEIPTLQLIDLHNCRASLVESAREIVKVQQDDYDNYDLLLRTYVNNDERSRS